jgi:hypothetical protein
VTGREIRHFALTQDLFATSKNHLATGGDTTHQKIYLTGDKLFDSTYYLLKFVRNASFNTRFVILTGNCPEIQPTFKFWFPRK